MPFLSNLKKKFKLIVQWNDFTGVDLQNTTLTHKLQEGCERKITLPDPIVKGLTDWDCPSDKLIYNQPRNLSSQLPVTLPTAW